MSLTDGEGNTALHMAAFLGHTDIVRALLKVGADPAVRNHLGFSSVDNVAVKWSSGLEAYYHNVEKVLNTSLDQERIRSERPCEQVHVNLAYRRFCRLDLADPAPDHSRFPRPPRPLPV